MTTAPWLLDNPRITRWYYRDPPAPGSRISYMTENYVDTVSHVTPLRVWLVSGRALWRPYVFSRIVVWSMNKISNRTGQLHHARPQRSTTQYAQLRADRTVLSV